MRYLLAAGLVGALGACSASRDDDLAACRAAEASMARGQGTADRVVDACTRAHRSTGSSDALVSATRAHLILDHGDDVVAAASGASGDVAPRLWHLAGDAEVARGRPTDARRWYERALEVQRTRDPRRAANSAGRIADLERAAGALDEAIRFQHESQVLAAAAGDADLSAYMTLTLTQMLLDVGDVRAARTTLASMTDQVRPSSSFYRPYLAVAGELDAIDGRPATAAASFDLCVRDLPPQQDPNTQLRCHVGRAVLAIADGTRDDQARRDLDQADSYLAQTNKLYGHDPDRAADVVWLRARLDLRGEPAAAVAALATLRRLAETPLGAATLSRISFTIGRTLVDRAGAAEGEPWFRKAAAAVEQLRDGAHYRELRRSLPRELRAPYEALFVLRHRAGDNDGALEAMETALARDFVDQLAASVAGDGDPAADHQFVEAGRRVRALRALDARPDVAFAPAMARVAIVGFFAAEDALWRVWVHPGKPKIEITRVDALAELAPLVKAVRLDPGGAASKRLRGLLLPDAVLPRAEAPLVIVPDPFLEGVRFAALGEPGRFLIERHPVVLAPTFAMAAGAGAAATAATGPAVVLGDPDDTLPHAREEAAAIAALLGVEPRLGRAADRAAVSAGRRARVLHVASHGSARDDGTIILLGDGNLGTADVLELGVAPALVVIASCTSAATRPDAMWTSIAAAFLASGAGTVVGATGSIPDDVARDIVVELHRHVGAIGPAAALARALRGAIARGTPVRSWSAFAVLGRAPSAVAND